MIVLTTFFSSLDLVLFASCITMFFDVVRSYRTMRESSGLNVEQCGRLEAPTSQHFIREEYNFGVEFRKKERTVQSSGH